MNSTTVAILAALGLALSYLYLENSEAKSIGSPKGNSGDYAALTAPSHTWEPTQSQHFAAPTQSSRIDACMAKENVNFDAVAFVRQEAPVNSGETYSFLVPEQLKACGLAEGQGRSLGATAASAIANAKAIQIIEQNLQAVTVISRGNTLPGLGSSSETSSTVKSELVKTVARGLVPIDNAYDAASDTFCACVAKRFVAADGDLPVYYDPISSNSSSASAPTQQVATPIIPPRSSFSADTSNGAGGASARQGNRGSFEFDAIVIDASSLASALRGDAVVLSESGGIYREVLNIDSYRVHTATGDTDLRALLRYWQADNPYTLSALDSLDGGEILISAADARALEPIKFLADESKVVFLTR